jgi:hypothetical protein
MRNTGDRFPSTGESPASEPTHRSFREGAPTSFGEETIRRAVPSPSRGDELDRVYAPTRRAAARFGRRSFREGAPVSFAETNRRDIRRGGDAMFRLGDGAGGTLSADSA